MNITLRRTTPGEIFFASAAERDEENRSFVGSWSEEQHRAALSDPDIAHCVVVSIHEDRTVGFVIIAGILNQHGSIEFKRIVITEKGKGYGKETLREVKRMAFDTLGAHRLWLDVKEHNARARALYESEGFRYEGTLRECRKEPNGYSSLIVMSMLEVEYREFIACKKGL